MNEDTNKILKDYVQGSKKIEVVMQKPQSTEKSIDYGTKGNIVQRETSKTIQQLIIFKEKF